jgi:hypothetical protein
MGLLGSLAESLRRRVRSHQAMGLGQPPGAPFSSVEQPPRICRRGTGGGEAALARTRQLLMVCLHHFTGLAAAAITLPRSRGSHDERASLDDEVLVASRSR